MGRHGLVSSAHPLASLTGVKILHLGGTVADAAVATNAMLAVTQPGACGIGGDLFALLYDAEEGRVRFLNASGRSGSLTSLDEVSGPRRLPERGARTVTVPGCVDGWTEMLGAMGTLELPVLLQDAIAHAEEGVPASGQAAAALHGAASLLRDDPEAASTFLPGGRPLSPGELLAQPALAKTLRRIAAEGRRGFYEGEVAKAIASTVLERGGWLTAEDLAGHRSTWGEPLAAEYRGHRIFEPPPNTQGFTVLQMLKMLEPDDLRALGAFSGPVLHLLVEAKKLAFADREAHLGDPETAQIDIDGLLDANYLAQRRRQIDPHKARSPAPGASGRDTTAFVVADGHGNLAAVIQSLYYSFGSGLVAPGTGVVLQNRGTSFSLTQGHPNCLGPRKRPRHTLIASMIFRDRAPWVAFATMGGDGQPQTHVQVFTQLIDFGGTIQAAIDAPRFFSGWDNGAEGPERLYLEDRFPPQTIEHLRSCGHRLEVLGPFESLMGHAHGLTVDPKTGTYFGGADPRGDGAALGW